MPLFLIIFPAFFFAIDRWFLSERGPYFWNNNIDPDYAYLFNGLEIIHRRVPGHIDHPGTTVQVLNGIVIYVTHLFSCIAGPCQSIDRSVFIDPEFYLQWINVILILIIAAAVFFFGLRVYQLTGNKIRALSAQFLLLLYPSVLIALAYCRPEPLVLAAAIVLIAILFDENIQDETQAKASLVVGALLGFGLATKIVFLPLVAFAFVFKSRTQKIVCLIMTLISAVFFTLPIISVYSRVFSWFGRVATHDGYYGGGNVGVPGLTDLFGNFLGLVKDEPFFFVNLFALFVFLIFCFYSRILLLCASVATLQFLMTVKHPSGHYLLPSMPVLVLANVKALDYIGAGKKSLRWIFVGMILAGTVLGFMYLKDWRRDVRRINAETLRMGAMLDKQPCRVLDYQGGTSKLYALNFGNWFTTASGAYNYSWILREVYPQGLTVNAGEVNFFSGGVKKAELQEMLSHGNCVVIDGRKILPEQEKSFEHFHLKPIEVGEFFGIYQVTSF